MDYHFHHSRPLSEETRHQGKWLRTVDITYQDETGKIRQWECVDRNHFAEAVIIVAQLLPSQRYILIKQFRPSLRAYVIEFPAGLIDPEESLKQAAIRELHEETGYHGQVTAISSASLASSPGILSERCYWVDMVVDEQHMKNLTPDPHNDPEEFIETCLVEASDTQSFFQENIDQGIVIDVKCHVFFSALERYRPSHPSAR